MIHVGVENLGGTNVTIQKFGCTIKHKASGKIWNMPVSMGMRSEQNAPNQPDMYPLGWISLAANEVWSGVVRCEFQPTEEQLGVNYRIQEEFFRKIQQQLQKRIFGTPQPAQVSEDLDGKAQSLFENRFNLVEGSYELVVEAILDRDEVSSTTRHFQIAPLWLDQLRTQTKDFKYGSGIYFPSQTGRIIIRLSDLHERAESS